MKSIIYLLLLLPCLSYANGIDYWSKNKPTTFRKGIATTSCSFYNQLDQSSEQTHLINELYKRWLDGWLIRLLRTVVGKLGL